VEVEVVTDQIKVEEVVAIKETKGMLEVDMGEHHVYYATKMQRG